MKKTAKQTCVMVHGATLTGLGEREHLNSPDVDLQMQINDVVNLILHEDLHDVVLAGHSYGGGKRPPKPEMFKEGFIQVPGRESRERSRPC